MTRVVTIIPQLRTGRGLNRFTYITTLPLQLGEVVRIPWRGREKTGVVVSLQGEPHPQAKAVIASCGVVLPLAYLNFLLWLADTYQISEPAALYAALPDVIAH